MVERVSQELSREFLTEFLISFVTNTIAILRSKNISNATLEIFCENLNTSPCSIRVLKNKIEKFLKRNKSFFLESLKQEIGNQKKERYKNRDGLKSSYHKDLEELYQLVSNL